MPRGGKRAGAGRKSTAERFARPIAVAEKRVADRLPQTIDNLEHLADGGYERVKEKWQPAALVVLELPLRKPDGTPMVDADSKAILAKQQVFPDAEPDQLVLVERSTETADRDRAANIYLVDRILGKPMQRQEIAGDPDSPLHTVGMTLDEWKTERERRRTEAEATLSLLDVSADA